MRFYIAVTDSEWFAYLSNADPLDELNFWQPSGGRQFRVLQPGEPFLFKLHSPRNYIVGGGFFSYFTILPVSFAWSAFTTKNGAQSEGEMRIRIARYRRTAAGPAEDYEIGCILLQSPFFFPEGDWIPASDWDPNIVQGRSYDTADERGQWIWQQVEDPSCTSWTPHTSSRSSKRALMMFGTGFSCVRTSTPCSTAGT